MYIFKHTGTFDNTLVIFGSDHGARFGNLRETALGRVEERLPLHLMVFPQWFRKDYKDMFETFQVLARTGHECQIALISRP